MNQARITLKPGVEIIAIEISKETYQWLLNRNILSLFSYHSVNNTGGVFTKDISLEDMQYGEILGRFSELSEEQCMQLVTSIKKVGYGNELPESLITGYKDYNKILGKWSKFQTAKESLKSALEANNIDPDKALIIKVNQ